MQLTYICAVVFFFSCVILTPTHAAVDIKHYKGSLERIERFNTWFKEHYEARTANKLKVKVGPAKDGSMRMGVYATEKIRPEDSYLKIPMKLVIMVNGIYHDEPMGTILRRNYKGDHQMVLLLYLMYERFANGQSFWNPYLDLLPTDHDIPMYFSDQDMALLKGTDIPDKAKHDLNDARTKYNAAKKLFQDNYPDVFPMEYFTWDNYKWALGILNTRMIWWDFEPHLVPMLDMINCKEGPAPGVVARPHRTFSEHVYAVTKAPWGFNVGDEVFENYGQNNPYYFYSHGFVLQPNSVDCASLNIPGPKNKEMSELFRKYELYRAERCIAPDSVRIDGLLPTVRVLAMRKSEMRELKNRKDWNVRNMFSRENERNAWELIVKVCNDMLEGFETSWKEDQEILNRNSLVDNSGPLTFRQTMAITYRMEQKKLLMKLLQYADEKSHKVMK
eukprot:PhF_6_TR6130/c0_g1_i1/m.9085/K19199/SETD3; histone-lysine N-methyltransferase SETD3